MSEVQLFDKVGTMQIGVDRLCKRLQPNAQRICLAYEAGLCRYGLYRRLVDKGLDCMVCAPATCQPCTCRRSKMNPGSRPGAGQLAEEEDLKAARCRLKSFLLAHGVHDLDRPNWGQHTGAVSFDSI